MTHPHGAGAIKRAGPDATDARATAVLVHGRGGSAADILSLAIEIDVDDVAYLAPEAEGNSWYPFRFSAPIERNQPFLNSALQRIGETLDAVRDDGVPDARIVLIGFSQGGCLTLEYAAQNARRYGGIAGLSGGLIGPDDMPRDYRGQMDGTPVFLGCSDIDPHIPVERVHETAAVLSAIGADVTTRIYPGWIHAVNTDEIEAIRAMLDRL